MKHSRIWVAAYIYYSEPWESLLVSSIKPLAENVIKWNLAEQFFFIRYWENGPHIRLRFGGDSRIRMFLIKLLIMRNLGIYISKNPSKINETYQESQARGGVYNNFVAFNIYEPEFARYGGPIGMRIAEKQFYISSQTILNIMNDKLDVWGYDTVLGIAIRLHLGLLHAFKIPVKEMGGFFRFVFENWIGWHFSKSEVGQEKFLLERSRMLEIYERSFMSQGAHIATHIEKFLKALEHNILFDQNWINGWVDEMSKIGHELKAAEAKNLLTLPKPSSEKIQSSDKKSQRLWGIMESYVHMTNNRLGVLNRDESYLGYLLYKSLDQITHIDM